MNKAEFLKALQAGLAAASPEERAAAVQYYTEYLDEAGPEREAAVLAELGSPEKVAADILGAPQQPAGAWTPPTAQGQPVWVPPEGPRAPEPPPQWREAAAYSQRQPQYPYGTGNPYAQPQPGARGPYDQRNSTIAKIIVAILAAILLLPLIGGFGSVLVAVLVALATLFFIPIILGIALLASGVLVAVCSVSILGTFLGSGLLTLGIGIALAGAGLLCLYAGARLLGKILPVIVRGAVNAVGSLWGKFASAVGGRA